MEKIDAGQALREKIKLLEGQRKEQLRDLKDHLDEIYDSLKPSNMIKSLFKDFSSGDSKNSIIDSLLGFAGGYLSRKIVVGNSRNPFKRIIGSLVQAGVSKLVTVKSDDIKQAGLNLLSGILKRKQPAYGMNGNGSHGVANEPYYE